jgi:uncharacterized protein YaaW (UPF0174 family)
MFIFPINKDILEFKQCLEYLTMLSDKQNQKNDESDNYFSNLTKIITIITFNYTYKKILINILLNVLESFIPKNLLKLYYEILYKPKDIENKLFIKILTDTLKIMSLEEIKDLSKSINLEDRNLTLKKIKKFLKKDFKENGFISYQLSLIVADAVAKSIIKENLMEKQLNLSSNIILKDTMDILKQPLNKTINKLFVKKEYKNFFYHPKSSPLSHIFNFHTDAFFSNKSTIPLAFTLATLRKKYEYKINEKKFRQNEI